MKIKNLLAPLLIISSFIAIGKPANKSASLVSCSNYLLKTDKIKMKFDPEIATVQLAEVKVDIPKSLYLKLNTCNKKLEVITKSGDMSKEIERIVMSSYPSVKSYKMKIHIKDIRLLYNQLLIAGASSTLITTIVNVKLKN